MGECELCEGDDTISYTCNECGGKFCSSHRLPENHRCEALLSKDSEGWFKEDLSVRRNRRSTRVTSDSRVNDSGEVADTGGDGATTGPGMVCSECDRAAGANCSECGDPYCGNHRDPANHDCTSTTDSGPDSVPDSVPDSDDGAEDRTRDAPEGRLPNCAACGRGARFECGECSRDLCLRHRRQANHECSSGPGDASEPGFLGRMRDALFGG